MSISFVCIFFAIVWMGIYIMEKKPHQIVISNIFICGSFIVSAMALMIK